jgi:hypothetical protein
MVGLAALALQAGVPGQSVRLLTRTEADEARRLFEIGG